MAIALHLVSVGVKPGDIASRPVTAMLTAVSPVQTGLNGVVAGGSGFVRNYFDLVDVRRQNQLLKEELSRMRSEQSRVVELETENRHLTQLLDLTDVLGLSAVGARVIGADANGVAKTLIVGQGSANGILPGMAVISIEGVVGKIIATSPHASRVLLIDDHNSALDAFDQRSRTRGIVAGVVDDGVTMKYVERSQDVRPGDTVVTSGLDGIFPRGLLIGTVKSVKGQGPGLFLNVAIAPAVEFRDLEQVLVITQMAPELNTSRAER